MRQLFIVTLLLISIQINSQIRHNCSVIFDVISTRTGCGINDGRIIIIPDLGEGTYYYSIDSGQNYVTDSIFPNLAPGQYHIFVKDSDTIPCIAEGLATVNSPISIVSVDSDSSCSSNTGKITINILGGEPSYFYSINGGNTFIPDSSIFRNVSSGNYDVRVQDNNGCEASSSIDVYGYPNISPIIDTVNILCNSGQQFGSVSVTGLSSNNNLFSLNNGLTFKQGNNYINDSLLGGNYNLLIIDQYQCPYYYNFKISSQLIDDSVKVTNDLCKDSIGKIELFGYKGQSPYEYSIDGGITFSNQGVFQNLSSGLYYTQVRDNIGCISFDTIAVTNFGGVNAFVVLDDTLCRGNSTILSVTHNAGSGANFDWNSGLSNSVSHVISPTNSTNYSVIVTDIYGCKDTAEKSIFVEDQPNVTLDKTTALVCFGDILTTTASGARKYHWSSGDTGAVLNKLINGNTTISVTGKNGQCTDVASINVVLKPMPNIIASANTTSINIGGQINFYSTGSTSSSFHWNFGDGSTSQLSNPVHQFNSGGAYQVVFTGSMGECEMSDTILIYVGTADLSETKELNLSQLIYPNPSTTLNVNVKSDNTSTLEIINSSGIKIHEQAINIGENKISNDQLHEGIFFFRFISKEEINVKKVILTH